MGVLEMDAAVLGGEGLPRQVNPQTAEQNHAMECVFDRARNGKYIGLLYLAIVQNECGSDLMKLRGRAT